MAHPFWQGDVPKTITEIRNLHRDDHSAIVHKLEELADSLRASGDLIGCLEATRYHCFHLVLNYELVKARTLALRMLSDARTARLQRYVSIAHMYLGIISSEAGESELACECYDEAFEIAKKLNDSDLSARISINLANVLRTRGRFETAAAIYRQGTEMLDPEKEFWTLTQLKSGLLDTCLFWAHDCWKRGTSFGPMLSEAKDLIDWLDACPNIDPISIATHDRLRALYHCLLGENEKALAILNDPRCVAITNANQQLRAWEIEGMIARRMDDYPRLLELSELRLDMAISTGACYHRITGNLALAEAYAGLKEFHAAYEALLACRDAERHLESNQTLHRSEILEVKLELDRYRQEHDVLRMRNQFLARRNQELEREVNIDMLSGVLNRRGAEEALNQLAQDPNRSKFGIMLLDIDHFKRINDAYGHAVGDQVITAMASLLASGVPRPIHIGRWGGEEFLCIFEARSQQQLHAISEAVIGSIRNSDWAGIHPKLKVTASLGMSLWRRGQSLDACIQIADQNLYRSKQNGRDQYSCLFDPNRQAA